jgi:hypothetical protein
MATFVAFKAPFSGTEKRLNILAPWEPQRRQLAALPLQRLNQPL